MELSNRLLKIAVVDFMAGSSLGLLMGMTQDFREVSVTHTSICSAGLHSV